METFIIGIIGLLSLVFLLASSIKILGWQKKIFETQLKFFISYGLNRQVMMLIGFIELFGAVAIWFQGSVVGLIGAGCIAFTSIGALYFHFRFDTWKDGIPAMVTLTLSSIVVITRVQQYL